MIFDASVAVVDNDKTTEETPYEQGKRNLVIFCNVSIFGKVKLSRKLYFIRV